MSPVVPAGLDVLQRYDLTHGIGATQRNSAQNSVMQGPMVNPRAVSLQFRQQIQQLIIGSEGSETGTATIADSTGQADLIE